MHRFVPFSINRKGELIEFSRPQVMGILNITPDSFYADSRATHEEEIASRVKQIISEGANIIDIGAYSSRPGAETIPADEEYRRLELGMKILRSIDSRILVSVDTFRADVARKAIEHLGADIINDISGGDLDEKMFETAAQLNVPYILMHMRGTPENMASMTNYANVTIEVIKSLAEKVNRLALLGVNDVIVDPGFGFSKNIEQNYELLKNLEIFHELDRPMLVGVSRKSMIYRPLGSTPQEALNGTTVLNTIALLAGASILRVHDVKEAVEAIKLVELTQHNNK